MGEMMNGKKIAKETREKLKIKCDELKAKGILEQNKLNGNKEALLLLLNNGLNGKYDIGMVNYLLALNILINFNIHKF